MRWVIVFALPSSVLFGACLFPDLNNLSNAGQTGDGCASCGDAAVDGADARPEASTDGSPNDGSPDSAAPFCSSLTPAPKFCEDFDKGLFSAQFTNVYTTTHGTLGADGTAFTSPPNALLASITKQPINTDQAFMTRVFTGTTTQVSYAFDLRIDSWVTGQNAGVLAAIVINDGAPNWHRLAFYITDAYASMEESFAVDGGNAYIDHALAWVPTLGVWTRILFSADLVAKTCSATINGNADVTGSALDSSWISGAPAIDIGWSFLGSEASPWAARFDNLVADWK